MAKAKPEEVAVKFHGGKRVFSKEIHGDEFMDNAKEFAETHSGEIIKPEPAPDAE